jgi:hypothetical protein
MSVRSLAEEQQCQLKASADGRCLQFRPVKDAVSRIISHRMMDCLLNNKLEMTGKETIVS